VEIIEFHDRILGLLTVIITVPFTTFHSRGVVGGSVFLAIKREIVAFSRGGWATAISALKTRARAADAGLASDLQRSQIGA